MTTPVESTEQFFKKWHDCKLSLTQRKRLPQFKEGEIWWCHVGHNVGIEINGKGDLFLRPVLVFKKFSALGFLGIPLTSRDHNRRDWYISFRFQNKTSWAVLVQQRTFSVERAFKRMGTVDDQDMQRISQAFDKFFSKNFP